MTGVWDRVHRTRLGMLDGLLPGALRVECIDMHTGGEPLRVILSGLPELEGGSVLACRRTMLGKHDHLRELLMLEPRGHADMYGLIPLPPERSGSDLGALFIHNEGYSTMCGHATIAIAKLAAMLGWIEFREDSDGFERACLNLDVPCGALRAKVTRRVSDGVIGDVRFTNVPSFVVDLDQAVSLPDGRRIKYDLAYGGAFYAYVDADQIGLDLSPGNTALIIEEGRAIKRALQESRAIEHPFEKDLGFLYGTIFIAPSEDGAHHSRNVCVFADGEVDRSPTGSGVSGRAAIHHARGELALGETIRIESIIGSVMGVTVTETSAYGPYENAVIPEVSGDAWVTGMSTFVLDPDDPFPEGFFLR